MSNKRAKVSKSSTKLPRNKFNKSLVAPSQDTIASTRPPNQLLNAPSQPFSVLSLSQIFAIPVRDASLPPPPGYVDCGNLQHIRNSSSPEPDATDDVDMLISFLQSNIIHDKGYTWGDATEVVRWLFGELTKRLNHFLDMKVAELPEGQESPELVRKMKGVSRDMRALVMWSRKRSHRQELVDFRGFDEDVKRWKLFDTSCELGIHDMVVLISEAKYRADFPGRGWISLENSNPVTQPVRRPLARKRKAENHASGPEQHRESDQVAYTSPGFSQTRSGTTQNMPSSTDRPILPARRTRKSRVQVFMDSPEQPQPPDLVLGAETYVQSNDMPPHQTWRRSAGVATGGMSVSGGGVTLLWDSLQQVTFGNPLLEAGTMELDDETPFLLNEPRAPTSGTENMEDFDPHSDLTENTGQKSSSSKRKRTASSTETTSKRRKTHSTSRPETSLPFIQLFPEEQISFSVREDLVLEQNFGFFSSFDSRGS